MCLIPCRNNFSQFGLFDKVQSHCTARESTRINTITDVLKLFSYVTLFETTLLKNHEKLSKNKQSLDRLEIYPPIFFGNQMVIGDGSSLFFPR